MKATPLLTVITPALIAAYALTGCTSEHDHDDHDDHDHDEHEQAEHQEAEHQEADDDHGHDHGILAAGPNGGRVIMSVEPHLEFFVTDDRKVRITALQPDNETAIDMADQTVRVISGDRQSPTRLSFTREGNSLLSTAALPAGNDYPVVVQISPQDGAKPVMERFNLNLEDCPTCNFKEYACACDHDDDHEGEHDHDDHG